MPFPRSFALLPFFVAQAKHHGHKAAKDGPYEHIVSQRPHEDPLVLNALPSVWDWRNVDGKDFTSRVQNQHQPGPNYCGACWAFATTSHLSARFNVATGGRHPDAQLNVQTLITCGPQLNNGCGGADPGEALKFIHEYGLPHESCHTYQGESLTCDAYNLCQDCMTDYEPTCWARPRFPIYHIQEYGNIRPSGDLNEQAVRDDMVHKMKAEIWKRGPIVCQIACPDPLMKDRKVPFLLSKAETKLPFGSIRGYMDDYTPFFNMAGENFEPFILNDTTWSCPSGNWDTCVDHDVTVVGWGEEQGTPYWVIQNSWGTWWGEGGFFRIVMGRNNLAIESGCFFGVPDVSDFNEDPSGFHEPPTATSDLFAQRFKDSAELEKNKDGKVLFS